jgi:hypothetical protein
LAGGGIANSAHGQSQTLPFNDGDLLLGVRATGGNGSNTDYEIDLGSALSYLPGGANATSLHQIAIGDIDDDLNLIFGSDWNSRSDVLWSISGAAENGAVGSIPEYTVFVTKPETKLGTEGTPWSRASSFTLQNPAGSINSMDAGSEGYSTGNNTPGQSISTFNPLGLLQSTSVGDSYASFMAGGASSQGNTAFSYFSSGSTPTEGNFGNGTANSVLNLFEIEPGTGLSSLVGGFMLNSAGELFFSDNLSNFSAIPEPSTCAAIAAAATFVLVFVCRGRKASGAPTA